MNKSTLNKVGITLSLLFLSQFSYSHEINKLNKEMLNYHTQRDVIISCSQYVVGYQYPNQSNQENVNQYLNFLHVLSPDLEFILNELEKMSSKKIIADIPVYIKTNNLSREQGITFCALKSKQSVNDILMQ